ncbi:hypothetical protein EHS25_004318 [Saitozyma podzolica]|uniref:SGNH hydrolase-type esterase domain-containing protein n=1 Tax=Saitozyma podzolica TaxID=1890683 RepID=A0A427YU30_9TREE|nr:hypothetical protein EHS25_004318 [Saitozyma podzolica]
MSRLAQLRLRPYMVMFVILAVLLLVFSSLSQEPSRLLAVSSWRTKDRESDEDIAMREWEYRRSLQHEGTGARMLAFLEKAKSGRPFTVSVVGGSNGFPRAVSHPLDPLPHIASSPLGAHTLYSPENMHVLIFEWLNQTFPHPENRFVNGAQGGVGASYFGWCFREHIPDDSDLVLVELGINDLVDTEVYGAYEHLIRSLLELDSKPAIINVEVFSTLFPSLISASALHQDVAAFYDIPSISLRDILMRRILADPHTQLPKWFRTGEDVAMGDAKVREWGGVPVDLMHISALGHSLAAGLVIRYIEEQMKHPLITPSSVWGRWSGSHRKPSVRILDVPSAGLTLPFDPLHPVHRQPQVCRSMNSPKLHGSVSKLHENPFGGGSPGVVPSEGSNGWTLWSWKEKRYLVARTPGAHFAFDFVTTAPTPPPPTIPTDMDVEELSGESGAGVVRKQGERIPLGHNAPGTDVRRVMPKPIAPKATRPMGRRRSLTGDVATRQMPGQGTVGLGYQRSKLLGFGAVSCWVDDRRQDGVHLDGWWDIEERNTGVVTEVARGLAPGPHTLHCELLEPTRESKGGNEFRIFAVVHD